jgi:hypothetical protein
VEREESPDAVTAAVRIKDRAALGESCARTERDLTATLQLPRPIGDRALITDAGPYQFRLILIPPAGRAAVRALVVPRRRDRAQPAPFRYFGPACDLVAGYLADVPEKDWCFS